MEWNSNPSSLWEWENLFEFGEKTGGNPKKLHQRTDCSFEKDRGVSSGSPGSDFGHASSKSSVVTASINSSPIVESKASNQTSAPDGFDGQIKAQQLDVSAGSGEPLLSLKLGKRMYFKDICSERNADSNGATAKRSKLAGHGTLMPRCQVEGCNIDLSSAKDYHRKHRICEAHSKSSRVVVNGVERRFCQQCSRFHGLAEFDEKKRSCRRRLSDHNARRRKPQPEAFRLNQARYSSVYEETQKMKLVFDPHLYSRHAGNATRVHTSESSKFGPTREFLSSNISMLYPHDPARLVPNKTTVPEFLHSGFEESVVPAEHDLHRALSLLSNNSQESKPASLNLANYSSAPVPPVMHQIVQGVPGASSEYWRTIDTEPVIPFPRGNPGTRLQDHHLFKASRDSGFYSYQFN